jgi:hypothetical protein
MNTRVLPLLVFFALILFSPLCLLAQNPTSMDNIDTSKFYVVTKNDGTEFIGKIISIDAREVVILTQKMGQVAIPKHEIKDIKIIQKGDLANGEYVPDEMFATRYFVTTNALPIIKGESYVQWNLWGPDFQFGVGKNFGLGIMSSWIAIPIMGTAKYTIPVSPKFNVGAGVILGTGSWALPEFGVALPFGALTLGDRKVNLNFSGGYGVISRRTSIIDPISGLSKRSSATEARFLMSFAAMAKVGKKASFVFDSFIMPPTDSARTNGFGLYIPGIRIQIDRDRAFQFGFAAIKPGKSGLFPFPIPFVQWYRKL